jgi:hypothetical protein
VSRVSRVPYHQNVYDLLQIEPGESLEAARLIEEHEAQHGPLPASVREWYLHAHAFPRAAPMIPLARFLREIDAAASKEGGNRWAYVMDNEYSRGGFLINLGDTADDPPVWTDNEGMKDEAAWDRTTDKFSEFAWMFVLDGADLALKKGLGYLWLLSQDEPFQPPVIDFLTDHFGEPERTPRPGSVTTYTYRPEGGTIRVTADEPALTGGLSAWWVHADTPERLAEFAKLLLPWGTLRETLRADTGSAWEVLNRVRE